MKNRFRICTLVLTLIFVFSCAGTQNVTEKKSVKGGALGGLAGAAAGLAIGSLSGNAGKGAAIGAAAGVAIGALIGHHLDKQEKELKEIPNTTVTRHEDKLVVTMSESIIFDLNSAALKPQSMQTVDQIATVMKNNPESDILVKGHTDSSGAEKYNQDLSERRANAVRNYLIAKGVAPARITALGFGMTMPIAPNDTSAGREKNRRVEIEIKPRPEQKS